jgi:hypothetical protein
MANASSSDAEILPSSGFETNGIGAERESSAKTARLEPPAQLEAATSACHVQRARCVTTGKSIAVLATSFR